MSEIGMTGERYTKARLHLTDDEFLTEIVLSRTPAEYPDPIIRDVTNKTVIQQYLNKVCRVLHSYTPQTSAEEEAVSEFQDREQRRLNHQIGKLTIPSPSEVSYTDFTEKEIEDLSYGTGHSLTGHEIPFELYQRLFEETSLKELRYLSAYCLLQYENPHQEDQPVNERTRVINAIRYIRGDPTVSFDNIIRFVPIEEIKEQKAFIVNGEEITIEEGISFKTIKEELHEICSEYPTLHTALAVVNIKSLSNYYHPKISNGKYNFTEMNLGEQMDQKTGKTDRNITAHELFHSLQDILGCRDMEANGNAVEFDTSPDEWEPIVFPHAEICTQYQKTAKELWHKLRSGHIEPLCNYQTKNIDEMFAVAFEAYYENPAVLKEQQPTVYSYIESTLSASASSSNFALKRSNDS